MISFNSKNLCGRRVEAIALIYRNCDSRVVYVTYDEANVEQHHRKDRSARNVAIICEERREIICHGLLSASANASNVEIDKCFTYSIIFLCMVKVNILAQYICCDTFRRKIKNARIPNISTNRTFALNARFPVKIMARCH